MTRYHVDYLITMEGPPSVVSPAVVDVEDGRVVWSGPAEEAPEHTGFSQQLDGLLFPGFVDIHTHTPMVLLRGAGEGLPVDRWLTEVMWPREGRLTPDDVRWAMTLGAAELLGNGITTSHEMYFYSEDVAEAAAEAGLRTVVTPPILTGADLSRFGSWEDQLSDMVEMAERYRDHGLITIGFGPHSAYALPEEPLRAVADAAKAHDLHIHAHVAEGRHEGDAVTERTGLTVPRYLESLGMLEVPLVAAHGVWLTDDDIRLFAERGVSVAHCPMSNGKHASGIAPVTDMRAAGVKVGIATDGPSSHDRLDPFEEMRTAIRLARLRAGNASAMTPTDALTMATREAAQGLRRDDLGHLTAGARADMVLVDTTRLRPVADSDDLVTHLVYSGSPEAVSKVWVEGRQVVDDGRPLTVDPETARREVDERARRLASE